MKQFVRIVEKARLQIKKKSLYTRAFGSVVRSECNDFLRAYARVLTHVVHGQDVAPHGQLPRVLPLSDDRQNGTTGPVPSDDFGRKTGRGDHYDRGRVTHQRHLNAADTNRVRRVRRGVFGLVTKTRQLYAWKTKKKTGFIIESRDDCENDITTRVTLFVEFRY